MTKLNKDEKSVLAAILALVILFALGGQCTAQQLSMDVDTAYLTKASTNRLHYQLDRELREPPLDLLDQPITLKAKRAALVTVLDEIERQTAENGYPVYICSAWRQLADCNKEITFNLRGQKLRDVLFVTLAGTKFTYTLMGSQQIVIYQQDERN